MDVNFRTVAPSRKQRVCGKQRPLRPVVLNAGSIVLLMNLSFCTIVNSHRCLTPWFQSRPTPVVDDRRIPGLTRHVDWSQHVSTYCMWSSFLRSTGRASKDGLSSLPAYIYIYIAFFDMLNIVAPSPSTDVLRAQLYVHRTSHFQKHSTGLWFRILSVRLVAV